MQISFFPAYVDCDPATCFQSFHATTWPFITRQRRKQVEVLHCAMNKHFCNCCWKTDTTQCFFSANLFTTKTITRKIYTSDIGEKNILQLKPSYGESEIDKIQKWYSSFIKMGLTQSSHQSGKGDVLWTGYCKVLLHNYFHVQGPPRQSSVLSCDMHAHCC